MDARHRGVLRNRLGRGATRGHGHGLLLGVWRREGLAGLHHVAVGVVQRAPRVEATGVRVGHDDAGVPGHHVGQGLGAEWQRGGVGNEGVAREQAGGRGLEQPVAVSSDEQGPGDAFGAHQRPWIGHAVDGQRWGLGRAERNRELGLIHEWVLEGLERARLAEALGAAQPGWRGLHRQPERLGPRQSEALDLLVVLEQHAASSHEPRHRGHGARVEHAVLQGLVEGTQQVHARCLALDDGLAADEGSLEQSRPDRVHGDAVVVVGEVGSGDAEHPTRTTGVVEVARGLAHVARQVARAREVRGQDAAVEQRGQVGHRERHGEASGEPSGAAPPRGDCGDARAEQEGEAEHHDGNDAVRGAHREAHGGALASGLDGTSKRRGVLEGVGPHRQHHADQHEAGREQAVAPPSEHAQGCHAEGQGKARELHLAAEHVLARRHGPGLDLVLAVEVPVPEATHDL